MPPPTRIPNERAVAEMEDRYFNWTTRDRSALKEWLLRYQRDPKRRLPTGDQEPAPATAPEAKQDPPQPEWPTVSAVGP